MFSTRFGVHVILTRRCFARTLDHDADEFLCSV